MKIVIVNTSERSGGAAIAASRLAAALSRNGEEVSMLVRDRQSDNKRVYSINTNAFTAFLNKLRFVWERLVIFLCNRFSRENLFTVSLADTGTDISVYPEVQSADIIHLHWINQGMLSLDDIRKLARLNKPVVWTMHDMWPFTGICHYAGDCCGFYTDCKPCPMIASRGIASRTLYRKQKAWGNLNLSFVACSGWLRERASHGVLTKGKLLTDIPNPIDTEIYRPREDRDACRAFFGLPADRLLLLFGAVKVLDKRKGFAYMQEAVEMLLDKYPEWKERAALVVFGNADADMEQLFSIPVYSLSYIGSDEDMVRLYNAADLYVTSSLEDNLPNTIMEAMACGLPCAGFRTGGIPEMIGHLDNGYVADYKSAKSLAEGMNWFLTYPDKKQLKDSAREKVLENYSYTAIAERYTALYKRLLR